MISTKTRSGNPDLKISIRILDHSQINIMTSIFEFGSDPDCGNQFSIKNAFYRWVALKYFQNTIRSGFYFKEFKKN